MEAAVRRLRLHRVGKHTHLRAEHFKQWQWKAYPGGQSKTPLRRERWVCLVDLVHHMWCTGGDPPGFGMDNTDPDSKGYHQHQRHLPVRDPVEGGVGADRHSPLRNPSDARCPPWVQVRKRYREGYNGAKDFPGARQYIP